MLQNRGKRGQVTIFVIIAVLLVVGVGVIVILSTKGADIGVDKNIQPVVDYATNCISESVKTGAEILGEQGGYIELPDFNRGSAQFPTGSQLNFLGTPVAHWHYISGNGISNEQIPTKQEMQKQLGSFVAERISACDFSEFRKKGYGIDINPNKFSASISDSDISFNADVNMKISFGDKTASVNTLKGSVKSKLGSFYSKALSIYKKENEQLFLENYAADVLRLYAPVDGVELSCGAKTWKFSDVDAELREALEANMQAIKPSKAQKDYFAQDITVGSEEGARFLYDRSFPTKIEVTGEKVQNGVMLAEPVGLQQGLGILGFCYVPYHFVYDIVFPVLVQIYDNEELFQFSSVVVIDKNKAKQAEAAVSEEFEPELCRFKNEELTVNTYNTELEPVEASASFRCLTESCDIGETKTNGKDAVLKAKVPQCVNGAVFVQAQGYAGKRQTVSTNIPGSVDVILDRLNNITLELEMNGKSLSDLSVVSFVSSDNTISVAWPEQKEVQLSEGEYEITATSYRNASITIPASTEQKCTRVAKPGLLGILGQTKEQCFDITVPSQTLPNVLSGGGKVKTYFLLAQLKNGKMKIIVSGVKIPTSLDELQEAYNIVETQKLRVEI